MPLLAAKTVPKPTEAPPAQRKGLLPIGSLGGSGVGRFRPDGQLPAVKDSAEIDRVLSAPQRPIPDAATIEGYVEKWTRRLELHPGETCTCPIKRLNGVQAWYLEEASTAPAGCGVVGAIRIGQGKTGIDVLVAMVSPGVKQAMLLVPSRLKKQFGADFQVWARHFRVPNMQGSNGPWYANRPVLRLLSYSELSRPSATTFFATHPDIDLFIWDECQYLKNRACSTGSRALEPFVRNESVRLCAHSGSLTTRGIMDYFHTCAIAFREGSPMPLSPSAAEEWAPVLDPEPKNGMRPPAGALRRLCTSPDEDVEGAFYRRRNMTPGFITTADTRLPVSCTIRARDPGPIPERVQEALRWARKAVRADWLVSSFLKVGEGDELVEQSEVARCAREAAVGLLLRWKYPRGEPEDLIHEWFRLRKAYGQELREQLTYHRRQHLDSPALWYAAAERYHAGYKGSLPVWPSRTWRAWSEIEDRVEHENETAWIDDYLVKDAAKWMDANPSGIVWVSHPAFGHALSKMTRRPYFGLGPASDAGIAAENGDRPIVASLKSHGTGKNLQVFSRALLVDLPSDAGLLEQCIGREYRPGQKHDVVVDIYQHTPEFCNAWDSIRRLTAYASNTQEFVVSFAKLEGLS